MIAPVALPATEGAPRASDAPSLGERRRGRRRLALPLVVCLMLFGAAINAVDLWHPIDGASRELWRETDVGGIARNFAREGMRFDHPQIDWRGSGPGYVEMEFPAYPYLIATGYRVFGVHEQIGRVLSFAFALGTLFLFMRLAVFVLPPAGAVAATLFFAVNPIVVRLANTIQPEPLMLVAYVSAVYAFIRWLDDDRWIWYFLAAGSTALAILAKAPAAHVGLVFLALMLWRSGPRALLRPRLWAFGVLALLPGILWYVHARGFWLTHGNSLGVSNQEHIVGLAALVRNPRFFIVGIGNTEMWYVWTAAGAVAVATALALTPRAQGVGYGVLWYAMVVVYYLVIAGTSAYTWASYYHVVSVPSVALLVGAATGVALQRWQMLSGDLRARGVAVATAAAAVVIGIVGDRWHGGAGHAAVGLAVVLVTGVVIVGRALRQRAAHTAEGEGSFGAAATGLLAITLLFASVSALRQTMSERHPRRHDSMFATARAFDRVMQTGVPIAVSGGDGCLRPSQSAYQEPWFFYWTDHKGYSLCSRNLSVANVDSLARRGARYFIFGDKQRDFVRPGGFEAEMRQRYPVLAETSDATLFDLGVGP